ncbi:MAG TPA: aconitate hydratase AcnA [Candidatus Megaira endosymbiont of Hartmannula sinica]|nr:aconitate hydratase AcnA [Candidatus Megaera endosymbiont of Hartmannula sinica]
MKLISLIKKNNNIIKKYFDIVDLNIIGEKHNININILPYSIRILLENTARYSKNDDFVKPFKNYINNIKDINFQSLLFNPERILMQDFTAVPAMVDLVSMRENASKIGINPEEINPLIPIDLVIDHSLSVDSYGNSKSFDININNEIKRNKERYEFLAWCEKNFTNLRIVPPGNGICHQVNIEYITNIVNKATIDGKELLYPDSMIGMDSHSTMVGAMGVLGWGVGGIEAESCMLGLPISLNTPEVISVILKGKLPESSNATDLVLYITNILRKNNIAVSKFVEFIDSDKTLSVEDRGTISNMAPEYGAVCGFFPVDENTIKYLETTSRETELIETVIAYNKHQKLWHNKNFSDIKKDVTLEIEMSQIKPSVSGPTRPQDKIEISSVKQHFIKNISNNNISSSNRLKQTNSSSRNKLQDGDIVIAAITSCTNTSNPFAMIGAGLIAKKAYENNLSIPQHVKTSLAPGSKVVTNYLKKSGLLFYLEKMGFYIVGYGCTTCIGNSGPLKKEIEQEINSKNIKAVAVLSGNRNFAGRIHPLTTSQYLASPIFVIAYAIAGTIAIDFDNELIGFDNLNNKEIYLKDIIPTKIEINELIKKYVTKEIYSKEYIEIFQNNKNWYEKILPSISNINITNNIENNSKLYKWDNNNSYIKNPPFFNNNKNSSLNKINIKNARVLAHFGDSITTDHISPAGKIPLESEASKYLQDLSISPEEFNSYGSRRGNHEIMIRGTFANTKIKNKMVNIEGGYTINSLTSNIDTIYNISKAYLKNNIPSVIIAGKDYGMGSSRDWAAKGTKLLGVKAVIAKSFERIHRSNLIGMGVLPLVINKNKEIDFDNLDITGDEYIDIINLENDPSEITCLVKIASNNNYKTKYCFTTTPAIYNEMEMQYYLSDGILKYVLNSNFN